MSYFQHHVFICTNQREAGEQCCNTVGGRCDQGPVMVVYPNETWYNFVDNEDVEEIIQEHLINGRVVERLKP